MNEPQEAKRGIKRRHAAWLLLDVPAVVAGAATASGFFARSWWRLEQFCHFRVIYFWPLLAYVLVMLLARRFKAAAAAGALALANLAVIVPIYFAAPALPVTGERIKLMSVNVLSSSRQYDDVLALARRWKPDLLLAMEVNSEWAEQLAKLHGEFPYGRVAVREGNFGMALYSRRPLVSSHVHELGRPSVPAIVAAIDVAGRRVSIVCAHPLPPADAALAAARNEQLAKLGELARLAGDPVVLLGDLNATGWSPYFADLLAAADLRDSRQGIGIQPTWPTSLPLRIPIDHCLVSRSIGVVARVVGPPVGSDHLPLLVELSVGKTDKNAEH